MKNSSKHKQKMGIYIRPQEGLYSVFKQGQFMPWAVDTKMVGRILRLEYNMLHSFFLCLPSNAWKIARVKKLREGTAFLTRKAQEFCNRHLVSLVSDFGTKMLWSQHFVTKAFHYHCLDLKYIAPKRFVTNKYMTVQMIRLNLHSFMDLISFDASILKELKAFVASLSAVSQKVTQVQYSVKGVRYVTHSS